MAKSEVVRKLAVFHLRHGVSPKQLPGLMGNLVSSRTARRWSALVKRDGKLERKKNRGRRKTARTRTNVKKVRYWVRRGKSQRQIAAALQISKGSIHNIINQNLRLRFYICRKSWLLTPLYKLKRRQFCQWAGSHNCGRPQKNHVFQRKEFCGDPDHQSEKLRSVCCFQRKSKREWSPKRIAANIP